MVRLSAAVRGCHTLHRHRQGREPTLPAAQRRDRLALYPLPAARRSGLPGTPRQPRLSTEARSGDLGLAPATERVDHPLKGVAQVLKRGDPAMTVLLSAQGLSKAYGPRQLSVDTAFDFRVGERVGLIGLDW